MSDNKNWLKGPFLPPHIKNLVHSGYCGPVNIWPCLWLGPAFSFFLICTLTHSLHMCSLMALCMMQDFPAASTSADLLSCPTADGWFISICIPADERFLLSFCLSFSQAIHRGSENEFSPSKVLHTRTCSEGILLDSDRLTHLQFIIFLTRLHNSSSTGALSF